MDGIGRGRAAKKTVQVKFPWEFTDSDAAKLPTSYAMQLMESCAEREQKEFSKYIVYAYCKTHKNVEKNAMNILVIQAMRWYFTDEFLFGKHADIVEGVHQHDFKIWKQVRAIKTGNNLHNTATPTLATLRKVVKSLKSEGKTCSKE